MNMSRYIGKALTKYLSNHGKKEFLTRNMCNIVKKDVSTDFVIYKDPHVWGAVITVISSMIGINTVYNIQKYKKNFDLPDEILIILY